MSVEIKFRVGGREVAPGDIGNAIQAKVLEHIRERVATKLSDVRCPEHGQYAQVTAEGEDLEHLKWHFRRSKTERDSVRRVHG
jgi:hypothetical protein